MKGWAIASPIVETSTKEKFAESNPRNNPKNAMIKAPMLTDLW